MQFSAEVWVSRMKGTEVGSASIQEAQLRDIQEYFGVNWQEALQYHGGNNSGCPLEMLKLSFILNFSYTSQPVRKGLNIDLDSCGIKQSWVWAFFLPLLDNCVFPAISDEVCTRSADIWSVFESSE